MSKNVDSTSTSVSNTLYHPLMTAAQENNQSSPNLAQQNRTVSRQQESTQRGTEEARVSYTISNLTGSNTGVINGTSNKRNRGHDNTSALQESQLKPRVSAPELLPVSPLEFQFSKNLSAHLYWLFHQSITTCTPLRGTYTYTIISVPRFNLVQRVEAVAFDLHSSARIRISPAPSANGHLSVVKGDQTKTGEGELLKASGAYVAQCSSVYGSVPCIWHTIVISVVEDLSHPFAFHGEKITVEIDQQ